MFREMRRKKQLLSREEAVKMLESGTSGVLALAGDDGYPYAVPISYVYSGDKIYFHSAKEGHKIDAINRCDKASFCVIGQDSVRPEEYTTYFKSVVVFGRIRVLEDEDEAKTAIGILAKKYHPNDSLENRVMNIDNAFNRMSIIELTVEHMSGKAAKEIVGK